MAVQILETTALLNKGSSYLSADGLVRNLVCLVPDWFVISVKHSSSEGMPTGRSLLEAIRKVCNQSTFYKEVTLLLREVAIRVFRLVSRV